MTSFFPFNGLLFLWLLANVICSNIVEIIRESLNVIPGNAKWKILTRK